MKRYRSTFILCIVWIGLLACDFKKNSNGENKNEEKPIQEELEPQPEQIEDLKGTKWAFKIADNCINTYLFKENDQYEYYSCETEDTTYGKYFVKNDTIHLHQLITANDSLLSADSPHRSEKAQYEIIMINDMLKHVARYSKLNGTWKKDKIEFDEDFLFERQ